MFHWLRVYDDYGGPRPLLDSVLLRMFGRKRIRKIRDAISWRVRGPIEYLWWQATTGAVWPLVRAFRFVTRMKRGERVLGIYNLWEQSGRVGDIIIYYQTLNVVRAINKATWIDICFIDDKKVPTISQT